MWILHGPAGSPWTAGNIPWRTTNTLWYPLVTGWIRWFSHWQWPFSIAMFQYQRPEGNCNRSDPWQEVQDYCGSHHRPLGGSSPFVRLACLVRICCCCSTGVPSTPSTTSCRGRSTIDQQPHYDCSKSFLIPSCHRFSTAGKSSAHVGL